jgi:hypothetical protein
MGVVTKLLNMVDQNVVKEGTVDAKSTVILVLRIRI